MSKVAKDKVVRFEYKLTDDKGEVLDQSEKGEPLAYMHGHGQIVPGLEAKMEGKAAGDAFDAVVAAEDGYGTHEADGVFKIPTAKLPPGVKPEVGMELASRSPDGHVLRFRLTEVNDDHVVADANHPLAGKTLHFAVKIADIRDATKEEMEHGHAHGHDHGHKH